METGLKIADGKIIVHDMETADDQLFSAKFSCPHCDYVIPELEPRLFSFNNPMGACPECDGLGHKNYFDKSRIVAFPELSLASGAIKGWDKRNQFYFQILNSLANHYGFDIDTPFNDLEEDIQNIVLHGSKNQKIEFSYFVGTGTIQKRKHNFEGVLNNFKRRYEETESNTVRDELAKFLSNQICPSCEGTRLRKEARNVLVEDMNLHHACELPLRKAFNFFNELNLPGNKAEVASKLVNEIKNRLHFLINVGLDYLSLSRSADTLSGGEAQRIRLASQIGSGLTGVLYVLDEPSIGLHQKDNDRLLETLKHLRDIGNTVIVVEHDHDAIMAADFVLDIGPGAGIHGGNIIAKGTPLEVSESNESLTGQYLSLIHI